jgi:hypothetical protein
MPDPRVGHPEDPLLVVDTVAEPGGAHDLELPLFKRTSGDADRAQRSSEGVLSIIAMARVSGDRHPGTIGRLGELGDKRLPALGCRLISCSNRPGVRPWDLVATLDRHELLSSSS